MVRGVASVVLLLVAACGRISFEPTAGDGGSADVSAVDDAPGSLIDDVFTAGETEMLVIDRGSPASYFDASGRLVYAASGEPRFDHDPITHEVLGLLVEEASANATHFSEQLDDGAEWFANGIMGVNANVGVAPDGMMTADAMADLDTGVQCRRAQSYVIANDSLPYTCSAFVKAGTLTDMTFGCELLGGGTQVQEMMSVDLGAGVVSDAPAGATAYGLEPIGNGWFRAWITLLNNGTGNASAALSFWSRLGSDATTGTYFAWGAQFEQGANPTSYISNPGLATVLRGGDNARFFIPPAMILAASVRVVASAKYDVPTAATCMIASGTQRICVDRDPATGSMEIEVVAPTVGMNQQGHGPWAVGASRWGAFTYDFNLKTVETVSELGTKASSWVLTGGPSQIVIGRDLTNKAVVHVQRGTVWSSVISAAELATLSP
jgi:hypothetical protein